MNPAIAVFLVVVSIIWTATVCNGCQRREIDSLKTENAQLRVDNFKYQSQIKLVRLKCNDTARVIVLGKGK